MDLGVNHFKFLSASVRNFDSIKEIYNIYR